MGCTLENLFLAEALTRDILSASGHHLMVIPRPGDSFAVTDCRGGELFLGTQTAALAYLRDALLGAERTLGCEAVHA
ncbi:MAG: hypothetical protein EOP64_00035 [Sphingomonas sp.]|nr:MAG: hypothetical protein EOP64_00035 [Sphingomonas sp.]